MESITTFYNTLFTAEIAIFGIFAAASFVFIQLVYGHFSYRHISIVTNTISFIAYTLLSSATLFATGVAILRLSFQHNDSIFVNESAALILFISFFCSLLLFASYAFFSVWYLRPHKMAGILRKRIKTKKLRNYLLKQYGIPSPESVSIGILHALRAENKGVDPTEESRDLEIEKSLYNQLRVRVQSAKDPLEVLNALILHAVNGADITSLGEMRYVFRDIAKDFFRNYKNDAGGAWSPDNGIRKKFLEHLSGLLRTYVEMSDRQNIENARVIFLGVSNDILNEILPCNEAHEIEVILNFWKGIGDTAIKQSPRIFSKVVSLYHALAGVAFEKGLEEHERWLDDVFRHLGWLGERLFSKKQFEEKPIIWDTDYSNEFDDLINAVWSYGYKYNFSYPNAYPLIYFDLIYVIFLRLVEVYTQRRLSDRRRVEIKDLLFSCTYVYSSFAEEAIKKGNSNGAALAAMHMKENLEHLMKNELQDIASEIVGLFIKVAAHAASHAKQLSSVEFLHESIDKYLTNVVIPHGFNTEIKKEIMDIYLKVPGDRKLKWNFIKDLGIRIGSNFDFEFDPKTGKEYNAEA